MHFQKRTSQVFLFSKILKSITNSIYHCQVRDAAKYRTAGRDLSEDLSAMSARSTAALSVTKLLLDALCAKARASGSSIAGFAAAFLGAFDLITHCAGSVSALFTLWKPGLSRGGKLPIGLAVAVVHWLALHIIGRKLTGRGVRKPRKALAPRVAILYAGDSEAHNNPSADLERRQREDQAANRSDPNFRGWISLFGPLSQMGVTPVPVPFHDSFCDAVRKQLLGVDCVHVVSKNDEFCI